ncbi:MAG: hypothetical protein RBQ70_00940 [Acholeplasma sp.]|jgi:hypothetical protein|nr:hypothetical protein [Acholeplasma sp.]
MKKLMALLLVLTAVFTLVGCQEEEKGEYTPGMYYASTEGNQSTFGVMFVNDNGMIEHIFIDSVYLKKSDDGTVQWTSYGNPVSGYATTKMALDGGWGYHMFWSNYIATTDAPTEAGYKAWLTANSKLEWFQQVQLIIDQVIELQDLPSKTGEEYDAPTGATITVSSYYTVIAELLDQAK